MDRGRIERCGTATVRLVCVLFAFSNALGGEGAGYRHEIILTERLGTSWQDGIVHRPIEIAEPGLLFPDRSGLFRDGKRLPMQLSELVTYDDGSIRSARVWFRSDLPAGAALTFALKPLPKPGAMATDLAISTERNVHTIANSLTAVRLPAGEWTAPGGEKSVAAALARHLGVPVRDGLLPAPLLGVRLLSGNWAAMSHVRSAARLLGYRTEILESGPIFVRVRVTYQFADKAYYAVELSLRSREPLVRIGERYEKAGALVCDLGTNLAPTTFATKASSRGKMQATPIDYDGDGRVPRFVGWDYYLADRTAVLGLLGGPKDDLLALLSTSADWLPDPYRQMMTVTAAAGGVLTLQGPLQSGHRHWSLLVDKGSAFPDPGRDLYYWWNRHVAFPLSKIVNWQLAWAGMDGIEFPHTFFSREDLPGIRERLRQEPTVQKFMEQWRKDADRGYRGWSQYAHFASKRGADYQQRFNRYRDKYKARGGTTRGMAHASAGHLYSGDRVYLEQLDDRIGFGRPTPRQYVEQFVRFYLDDIGVLAGNGAMGNMNVSDCMLLRCVAFDLVLGSDMLTGKERRDLLTKLAFMVYVMHDPWWQPPVHMPDGTRPAGYGQGTPNQKHCAFSCRAMTACMLKNHPMKKEWLRFAMAELRPHYSYTIAESGALLESPFYSSRDTMRYAPFWRAMVRAGVAEVAPDYEKWMDRPKRAFEYLANMLTPREPRMEGKRVYHPIGRSNTGVIDPTFMIGADPWAEGDPQHGALMRWCWEEQGRPSPDTLGATGGRNIALTLLSFSKIYEPLKENPLRSRRWEGMGATLRSNSATDYESNVVFRHDPFCWDLYPVNNGAVYFYGKGAPLLPRFGAYWGKQIGGAWMMGLPFGNRVEFAKGDNRASGRMTEFVSLGRLADLAVGITHDKHWQRSVLFAKDLDKPDPVYLLVRDDVSRPGSGSVLNWWVMSKAVQPDGLTKPGVVSIKIPDREWVRNLGKNWEQAAKAEIVLKGQRHFFEGQCGVDLDLFIAVPSNPSTITDAASTGRFPYCTRKGLYETQQLVRIKQAPGKGFLTLLMPRLPGAAPPECRTIADGAGVAVRHEGGEDRLFLSNEVFQYEDEHVVFEGTNGFVRHGAAAELRLLVTRGRISADGVTLSCPGRAALVYDGKAIEVIASGAPEDLRIDLPPALKQTPVTIDHHRPVTAQ